MDDLSAAASVDIETLGACVRAGVRESAGAEASKVKELDGSLLLDGRTVLLGSDFGLAGLMIAGLTTVSPLLTVPAA